MRGRVVRPIVEFLSTESAAGVVLVAATLVALVWANSPWNDTYTDILTTTITIDLGFVDVSEDVHHWVNDGLMTIFFFVVGLEIKRELLMGELNSVRRAALPVAAALGGMVVPAALYLALNAGGEGEDGWGIPMATDIAFAVGLLALLGTRAPFALRVFLLALAIVDDLGAIAVIAVFYTDDLAVDALGIALGFIALILVMQRANVRDVPLYIPVGALLWLALLKSGVHATIAGVILGILTPHLPFTTREEFTHRASEITSRLQGLLGRKREEETVDEERYALQSLEDLTRDSESPLERLEHFLHPWSSFGIVPIFALANAGIELNADTISDALESEVMYGIVLGLVVGKTVGIFAASWLAVRSGMAELPAGVRWPQMLGVAMLAGVGFTVSLFITELAFTDAELVGDAKIGILGASAIAGAAGFAYLWMVAERAPEVEPSLNR
ncbi:MAG TPA: Na+/H+ antiporter NhaA [Dehalococcoidia bacterium]|nr:Na+/H+ antiporter NhaA [Dehalococcoidia bacterium]